MKGIYLTEKGKEEIEVKLAKLEKYKDSDKCNDPRDWSFVSGRETTLKEILSLATILSVEESWRDLAENSGTLYHDDADVLDSYYPNGVIIIKSEEL